MNVTEGNSETKHLDAIVQKWLNAYSNHNFSALDLRKFWASRVPGLFKIPANKNSLSHKFDQPQIDKILFGPLEQFITASQNPTEILNPLKNNNQKKISIPYPWANPIDELTDEDDEDVSSLDQDLLGRFEIVASTIMNYSVELLCLENYVEPPKDLESEEAANLESHAAILFIDIEIHRRDEVIASLIQTKACEPKDAEEFASTVYKNGRGTVKVGRFEDCKEVKDIFEGTTSQSAQARPIKCEVIQMLVVAHQEHAIQLLAWLQRMIINHKGLCRVFGQVMQGDLFTVVNNQIVHQEVNIFESMMINYVKLWGAARWSAEYLFASGMLNKETKKFFAKSFTKLYGQLMQGYINDSHDLSSIINLSDYIFPVPSLSRLIIEEEDALHLISKGFYKECDKHVVKGKNGGKLVVKPDQATSLKRASLVLEHLEWLLVTTPANWTEQLRKSFLHGFETIIIILKWMQGMDSITRQDNQDVETEMQPKDGIYLQLQMGRVVTELLEWCGSDLTVLQRALKFALNNLHEKMEKLNYKSQKLGDITCDCIDYDVSSLSVSIHLPLSRAIAGLLLEFSKHDLLYSSLEPPLNLIELMEMPLRTLVMISQFRAGMWDSKLRSLSEQVTFYNQAGSRNEMLDQDIVMMQYVASKIDPNHFLIHLLNKFDLMRWVDDEKNQIEQNEDLMRQTRTLVEEFLNLLLAIVSERHTPGVSEVTMEDKIRKEFIQFLCILQWARRAQLLYAMSLFGPRQYNICKKKLGELTVFKRKDKQSDEYELKGKQSGDYELKEQYYKDFNPLFYHYTQEEKQKAKESQLNRKRPNGEGFIACTPPVPPELTRQFKPLRNVLACPVFMHIVKMILEHACDENRRSFSENQYETTLHLVGVALYEEQRDLDKEIEEKFSFIKVAKENDLFNLLERCAQHSTRVKSHQSLTDWLLKFRDTVEERKGTDEVWLCNLC